MIDEIKDDLTRMASDCVENIHKVLLLDEHLTSSEIEIKRTLATPEGSFVVMVNFTRTPHPTSDEASE